MFEQTIVQQLKVDVGDELSKSLMNVFINESTKIVEQLQSLPIDDQQVILLSHSLKSSAKTYGALILGNLCEQIEMSAKAGDSDALSQAMADLPDIANKTFSQAIQFT